MKFWEYLRKKIKPYSERVAFADSGITYGELLSWGNNAGGEKRLQVCKGGTREEQALAILKCLAGGAAVVPVSLDYGLKQYNYICERCGTGKRRHRVCHVHERNDGHS